MSTTSFPSMAMPPAPTAGNRRGRCTEAIADGSGSVHPPLGRDGPDLGNQPHDGGDSRVSLHHRHAAVHG